MVKIAGMNFHYVRFPFSYFLDSMVEFGINNIELWGGSPHLYTEDISLQGVYQIKNEINERKLKIVCFTPEQCAYPINIASRNEFIRERSIRYFEKSLMVANELESPYVLVTPGLGYFNENKDEAWERSSEALKRLAVSAKKMGVTLILEPLKPTESNLINGLSSLKKMITEVDSKNLKGMIDTNPMSIMKESMKDYFELLGDDLVHIHFIDGPDGHLVWGEGTLPLQDYMGILKEYDYNGYLSFEYTSSRYYLNPNKAMEDTLKILNPYLKQ